MGVRSGTIVVVDDDVDMNLALKRLLNAAGFNALTFASAEALLATSQAENSDCLIFDIHLPGLSGFELSHKLRQQGVTKPLILMTAYDDQDFFSKAKEVNAAACITKPFPGKILISAISQALEPRQGGGGA